MKEERIIVSIPATEQGICAINRLAGVVKCNATCVFSLSQAMLAADAGASMVSVGVGDVSDYWRWKTGTEAPVWEDRGVLLCTNVQMTLRTLGYHHTAVVATNCRTIAQVLELAGVDCVTLAPWMLHELACRDAHEVYNKVPHQARVTPDQYMLRPSVLLNWPRDATDLLQQTHTRCLECYHSLERTLQHTIDTCGHNTAQQHEA